LDRNDRFRLIQTAAQRDNLTIGLGRICLQRVGWSLFRTARTRLQRTQRARRSMPAPVGQSRRIKTLPT